MVETVAPGFVTPSRGVQIPPVVSIVGTGRPLSEGIRLIHNKDRYGFIIDKDIEGFGLAPVENTITESSRGGGTRRHTRWATGDMFLPITLVSPNPESMYDMMAWLVDTVTGQGGVFDVVYFDPYSQEARRRTVLYDSGLETVNEQIPDFKHVVGITGTFLSPFWRGPERVVVERIAPPVKPLITADPGQPIDRWPDPDFSDSSAYAPWLSSDEGLVKWGTGDRHGGFFSSRLISVVAPGDVVTVEAALSFVAGPPVGHVSLDVRALDAENQVVDGSQSTLFSESYAGTYSGEYTVPNNASYLVIGLFTEADVHSNTQARVENLSVRRAGDEIVGAYSFPFFPIFLADSTVQGEHELTVEGDAPVWPVWEIQGPGRDVEIIGPDGSRLFVEGEVTSPITIVTEPGKRSIRDASGLIWERMKPGDDQFFALEPGEQTIKMTMVGGNPESTIRAVYSENWKTPRGTAQGMIRGGSA